MENQNFKQETVNSLEEIEMPESEAQKETFEEALLKKIEKLENKIRKSIDQKKEAELKEYAEKQLERVKETEVTRKKIEDSKKQRQLHKEKSLENKAEKPKGFIDKLKEKNIIRKLKKEGIENPEKVLEFVAYVKNKGGGDAKNFEQIKSWGYLEAFEYLDDPIVFYEKVNSITGATVEPCPSEIKSDDYWIDSLIKIPNILEKLNLCEEVKNYLGLEFNEMSVQCFCEESGLQSKLSKENLEKVKNLIEISDKVLELKRGYGPIANLEFILDYVENEDHYELLTRYVKDSGNKLSTEFLDQVLKSEIGEDLLIGNSNYLNLKKDVLSYSHEMSDEKKLRIKALNLGEFAEDKAFSKFAEDFHFLKEDKFSLEEYELLKDLYENHKEHALAFYQVFEELEIADDFQDFYLKFNEWRKDVKGIKDFFLILDESFQEVAKGFENCKDYMSISYLGYLAFVFNNTEISENSNLIKEIMEEASFDFNIRDFGFLFFAERDSINSIGMIIKNIANKAELKICLEFIRRDYSDFVENFKAFVSIKDKYDYDISLSTLLNNPEIIEKLDSWEAKKLMDSFDKNGISLVENIGLFDYPENSLRLIEMMSRFFNIDGRSMDHFIKYAKENTDEFLNFMASCNFKEEKSYLNFDSLAILFDNLKDFNQLEFLGKHSEFYFNGKVVAFIEDNPDKVVGIFSLAEQGVLEKKDFCEIVANNLEDVLRAPSEKINLWVELYKKLDGIQSSELQKTKKEIARELLYSKNPEEACQEIIEVFTTNCLPMVGKKYKVFSILYNPQKIKKDFEERKYLSPYLEKSSSRRKYFTFYRDLLNISIKSNDSSLRKYLEVFQEGQAVFEKIDIEGEEGLDETERRQAEFILKRFKMLWLNSALSNHKNINDINLDEGIETSYIKMRALIKAEDGQSVEDRVSQMFLKPARFNDVKEVLDEMKQSKELAKKRNFENYNSIIKGDFSCEEGDLVKGVDAASSDFILEFGMTAGEFLGVDAGSDQTPYDSDFIRIPEKSEDKSFIDNINHYSIRWGDIDLIIKNRGQFSETSQGEGAEYDVSKFEIFNSGVMNRNHYGVRTGLPSTEIDLIVSRDNRNKNLFLNIAKNGFYIPVVDEKGRVVFDPEQYEEYRKVFRGIDSLEGDTFEYLDTKTEDFDYDDVEKIRKDIQTSSFEVQNKTKEIRNLIKETLEEFGIQLKDEYDDSIFGANLLDIGSTGRGTNMTGDFDFDYSLCLDNQDIDKVSSILDSLRKKLGITEDNGSHDDVDGYQLRVKNCKVFGEEPLDIDVGFVRKNDLINLSSGEAIQERFDWIKNNIGKAEYEKVIANIVLTKKILKEGGAYKKFEDGGIGGVGVENWILLNDGNMIKAFESFLDNALGKDGEVISLDDFRGKYSIIDPGLNLKGGGHDDFVYKLKKEGYNNMIKVIRKYLDT